ncbi:MAG: ABC transporter substrate-binding protein [Oscillospiraceae bacterium]|nr:ABC transporter substrate-binding protein [Oscillospiraceae bacterium]
MRRVKLPALLLALTLLFSLAACKPAAADPSGAPSDPAAPSAEPTQVPSEEPSAQPSDAPSEDPFDGLIRVGVLNGPTGVGAAKLLNHIDNNDAYLSYSHYRYDIYTDNTELMAGLTKGEIDIATVASNVALNLYNKTDGGVKIIAVGTLGVLHILEGGGGTEIDSVADLAGRTVYAAGQGANPEYVLRYLLQENGLEMGKDVEVVFADASEISAKLLSGEIECAMLPVPAATAAIVKSEGSVRQAVDLTEAWDSLKNGSQLIMTAVVARTEYVEEHPELVSGFLYDYKDSINFVNNNVDAAAEMVAELGLVPSAGIAKQAIPQCHLAFIDGMDMVAAMSDYYSVLYSIDPAAVGGSLPDDGIYWWIE